MNNTIPGLNILTMPSISIFIMMIIITVFFGISTYLLIKKTKTSTRLHRLITGILVVSTVITAFTPIYITTLWYTAHQKGLTNTPKWYTQSIYNLNTNIHLLPNPDKLPKTMENKIFIFYKPGCIPCKKIHNELRIILGGKKDIYWINADTPENINTVKQYKIQYVPSILYINPQNTNDIYKHTLALKTEHDDYIVDKTVINEIFTIYDQNH